MSNYRLISIPKAFWEKWLQQCGGSSLLNDKTIFTPLSGPAHPEDKPKLDFFKLTRF
jgi:hypothetical protein